MNLLEALKTGGVFRRPHDKFWWGVHKDTGYIVPEGEQEASPDFEILPVTAENLQAMDWEVRLEPVGTKYRTFVLSRTNPSLTREQQLANSALGLVAEAGEAADVIKKHLFHGHTLDRDKLVKELGDVLFYFEWLSSLVAASRTEVELTNISKLTERYPNGFTEAASVNRKS